MAMLLYRILFLPALLVALPHYLFRMWRRGGYRDGFRHRFGFTGEVPPKRPGLCRIWIQAVSVGELNAVAPLVEALNRRPDVEIILTATTSTGFHLLREKFAGKVCWAGVFPIDFWLISARAWRHLDPDLALLMEGELWPEHIHQAKRLKVPVLLVNARLSDRSFRRHQTIACLGRAFFNDLYAILAGSESDLNRFRELGWISSANIHLTGNLKLDIPDTPPPSPEDRFLQLREFGFATHEAKPGGRTVLLGSSTWPGEESALVKAFTGLHEDYPDLRLLIVPRHAERRHEISEALAKTPFPYHFRSEHKQAPEGTMVYVADTTGELKYLTGFADLVFVGKSLPPNSGGQTPIEAAGMGKPLCFGPSMSNFRDVTRLLLENRAAVQVADADSLPGSLRKLLDEPAYAARMGQRARDLISASRGATAETLKYLEKVLSA